MTSKAPTPMPEGVNRPKAPYGPPKQKDLAAIQLAKLYYPDNEIINAWMIKDPDGSDVLKIDMILPSSVHYVMYETILND